jgi:hypothetical protein
MRCSGSEACPTTYLLNLNLLSFGGAGTSTLSSDGTGDMVAAASPVRHEITLPYKQVRAVQNRFVGRGMPTPQAGTIFLPQWRTQPRESSHRQSRYLQMVVPDTLGANRIWLRLGSLTFIPHVLGKERLSTKPLCWTSEFHEDSEICDTSEMQVMLST